MKQKQDDPTFQRNRAAKRLHLLHKMELAKLEELVKFLEIDQSSWNEWQRQDKLSFILAIKSWVIRSTDAEKLRQLAQMIDDFKSTPTKLTFDEWWKTVWEDVEAVDWRHCETCVGTGKLPSKTLGRDDVDCGECDGRGRITVYQLDDKRGTQQELYDKFTPVEANHEPTNNA